MLSRVADSLYWMSRYLERAEHTARLLDVQLNLMLEQSLDAGSGGTVQLEAEDGRYTISLARVVYVKRFSREGRVGFSGG